MFRALRVAAPGARRAAPRAVLAAAFALLLASTGCDAPAAPRELALEGEALGTVWAVTLVMRDAPDAERLAELRRRVVATLDRIDRLMSTWRDDTEITRFNRWAAPDPFRFSPETRRVIAAALEISRETGGAFDPTVGPLVRLWGFGSGAAERDPTEDELARARARTGWRHLEWDDEGRLVRRVPAVELDLSALAKGYAVDAIVGELARDRPLGALVEVGGEVRALGAKASGEPWRVGDERRLPAGEARGRGAAQPRARPAHRQTRREGGLLGERHRADLHGGGRGRHCAHGARSRRGARLGGGSPLARGPAAGARGGSDRRAPCVVAVVALARSAALTDGSAASLSAQSSQSLPPRAQPAASPVPVTRCTRTQRAQIAARARTATT
jgi:hypothetical protein